MLRGLTDRDGLRDEATKCLRGYARMLYRFSNTAIKAAIERAKRCATANVGGSGR